MREPSPSLTDPPLIVPDFGPEYAEEILELDPGIGPSRGVSYPSLASATSEPQSEEEPSSGTSSSLGYTYTST